MADYMHKRNRVQNPVYKTEFNYFEKQKKIIELAQRACCTKSQKLFTVLRKRQVSAEAITTRIQGQEHGLLKQQDLERLQQRLQT